MYSIENLAKEIEARPRSFVNKTFKLYYAENKSK